MAYTGDTDDCCFSDDTITMGLQACTHWDALAHVSYAGKLYNGFPASSVTAERGATRCGIHKVTSIPRSHVSCACASGPGCQRSSDVTGRSP